MNRSIPRVGAATREERWAGGGQPRGVQPVEDELEPRPGAPRRLAVAAFLGHDQDEQAPALLVRLGLCLLLECFEQLIATGGAVGHRQRYVERQPLGVGIGDEVLDGKPGRLTDAVDQVGAQPAGSRLRIRGDDYLLRVVFADGVHRGAVGVWITNLADRVDALVVDEVEREIDAHLRGVEHSVVIDDESRARAVLRDAEDEAEVLVLGHAPLHRLDQTTPAQSLVGDDEDRLHSCRSWLGGVVKPPAATLLAASTGGLKMPCTARGTPYS